MSQRRTSEVVIAGIFTTIPMIIRNPIFYFFILFLFFLYLCFILLLYVIKTRQLEYKRLNITFHSSLVNLSQIF